MRIQEKIKIPVETYKVNEKVNDKTGKIDNVYLEGIAITFDKPTRNRVRYSHASGKAKCETLIGKPFLDTHDDTSIRRSPPFGHVEDAYIGVNDRGENVLKYRVNLDPDEKQFIHKAKRGDIPGVSIQVLVDGVEETEELNGEGFLDANIAEFLELSAVLIPGDGDSTMAFAEKFCSGKREKRGQVNVDKVPGDPDEYGNIEEEEELDTSNGGALVGTGLPKKVRKSPEPQYERNTQLAAIGISCPACGTQMLHDIFTSKERIFSQLRCYKCAHTISDTKESWKEAVKDAWYRINFEV